MRRAKLSVISGVFAITVTFGIGIILRGDIAWWWATGGVKQVWVNDYKLGRHVMKTSSAVSEVKRATKEFIRSLSRKPPSEWEIPGYLSEVAFMTSDDHESMVFSVRLDTLRNDRGVISCMDVLYTCNEKAWLEYLRRVIKPVAGECLAAWKDIERDAAERYAAAGVLALVMPESDGLVAYFHEAVVNNPKGSGLWFLARMGPAAVTAINSIINNPESDDEVRRAAMEAFEMARGE